MGQPQPPDEPLPTMYLGTDNGTLIADFLEPDGFTYVGMVGSPFEYPMVHCIFKNTTVDPPITLNLYPNRWYDSLGNEVPAPEGPPGGPHE